MDTRSKIVPPKRVAELAQSGAYLVSGCFDPLVAGLAAQLASLKPEGVPLVVLIRSAAHPILPPRARAELVAALAVVDYVCDAECDSELSVSLEHEHAQRLQELIAHVHARQEAGRAPVSNNTPASLQNRPATKAGDQSPATKDR